MSLDSIGSYIPFWFAITAFGFTGSLHCAGMCGPLAAAACSGSSALKNGISYHIARVTSYIALGFLAGLFGMLFFEKALGMSSRLLGIALGSVLVLYSTVDLLGHILSLVRAKTYRPMSVKLRESTTLNKLSWLQIPALKLRAVLRRLGVSDSASLGLLTAVLPCGFLYAALTQSLLSSSPVAGGIGMGLFAISTMPALSFGSFGMAFWMRKSPKYAPVGAAVLVMLASVSVLYRGIVPPHSHVDHEEGHEHHEP